jgi:hypothetical protein
MAKAGQHHNSGLSSSKPRGHEQSRGRNRPEQTTIGKERNEDIRDEPSNFGSTRARESSLHGRSGSDSNADSGSRGH